MSTLGDRLKALIPSSLKAFSGTMAHPAGRMFWAMIAGTGVDWKGKVGDGMSASVVAAPVQWFQRAIPEAPFRVSKTSDGEAEIQHGHPLAELIDNPNPFYSGFELLAATVYSYLCAGNAYWLKAKNLNGGTAELWYLPHNYIEPMWPKAGSDIFISHYEYKPGGSATPIIYQPDEIVHFRHGIDPTNTRKGVSPLAGALREIYGDGEAANYLANLLRNMGVPGIVISPKDNMPGGQPAMSPEDAEATKAAFKSNFSGDQRGETMVVSQPIDISQFAFTPQQMDMSSVRDTAEERVCAALGIPAAVVGFGTGMQQTKVGATLRELRRLAWVNGVVPVLRNFAKTIERSLLPEFVTPAEAQSIEAGFDLSQVAALAEDDDAKVKRSLSEVTAGTKTVGEHRREMGMETDASHDIYLRGFSMLEVPIGLAPKPPADPASPGEGDDKRYTPEDFYIKDDDPLAARIGKRPSQKPTRAQARYNAALERSFPALQKKFAAPLEKFFDKLGSDAAKIARDVLGDKGASADSKDVAEDRAFTAQIMKGLEMLGRKAAFKLAFGAAYLLVAEDTAKHGELVGLGTDLPNPMARAMTAAGGRRAGLVDLTGQTKAAIFKAITEGRAEGEGAAKLARRIRDIVPAGPWKDAKTRSMIIARTETKFAQNTATIERARAAGVDKFIVFDARLGDTDEECEALDGTIVSADEAEALALSEHPNGTRSFTPHFEA